MTRIFPGLGQFFLKYYNDWINPSAGFKNTHEAKDEPQNRY